MNKDEVIRKIQRMMAIAQDPSASDQEIQLATYRANKLRIKYKIEEIDLFDRKASAQDITTYKLKQKASGYMIWAINHLVESFQCKSYYYGKINSNDATFGIVGLKSDVELCIPVVEGLVYYLKSTVDDLQDCYIGYSDFRIYKRDYLSGFANGLKAVLDKSLLEMNLDKKYELAVIDVPAVVKNWFDEKVNIKSSHHFDRSDPTAYDLGYEHGLEYNASRKDLLT